MYNEMLGAPMTADTITSFAMATTSSASGGGMGAATAAAPSGFAALVDAGAMPTTAAAPLPGQADMPLPPTLQQVGSALTTFDDMAAPLLGTQVASGQQYGVTKAVLEVAPEVGPVGHVMPTTAPPVAVVPSPSPMDVDVAVGDGPIPGEVVSETATYTDCTAPTPKIDEDEGPLPLVGDAAPSTSATPVTAAPMPLVSATLPAAPMPQGMALRVVEPGTVSDPHEVGLGSRDDVMEAAAPGAEMPDVTNALPFDGPRVDGPLANRVSAGVPDTSNVMIRHSTVVDLPTLPAAQLVAAAPQPSQASDAALRLAYSAAPAATAPLPQVNVAAGHFGAEIGAIVRRQIAAGREEVTVRLDPGEMGKVHIRFSFDPGGELRAVVATETPAALELLRRDVGQLDRALAQAGVRTDAGSFRFDEGQSGGGFAQSHPGHADRRFTTTGEESAASSPHTPVPYRAALPGRVDMLA
jgi:hypothetical protein